MPKCKDCNVPYGKTLFLWLDDKLWKDIGCKENDYLCAHCIIHRLERFTFAAYLIKGDGDHKISLASLKIKAERIAHVSQKQRKQPEKLFSAGARPVGRTI